MDDFLIYNDFLFLHTPFPSASSPQMLSGQAGQAGLTTTTCLRRQALKKGISLKNEIPDQVGDKLTMEPRTRLELVTSSLPWKCSTN